MKPSFWMAAIFAGALGLHAEAASALSAVGAPLPSFVGTTLDDRPLDLSAYKGHVMVVNLWATWCTPCRAEMPMLDSFHKHHQAEGLALIGLSADRHRDAGDVKRVMTAFSYPAALLADAKSNGFGAPGALPMTYVVDRRGVVRTLFNGADGPLTEQKLEAAVAAAGANP